MADNMQGRPGEDLDVESPRGAASPTTRDPGRLLPEEAEAAHSMPRYDDPQIARSHIEATRSRMSETIDEIEDSLLRKKHRIQDRLDVTSPIRESPWQSMGIALGAGLLLGMLTAGQEEPDEQPTPEHRRSLRDADRQWKHRAGLLERRSRRLLRIAREQEEELERMQRKLMRARRRGDPRRQVLRRVRGAVASRTPILRTRFEELRESILSQLAEYLERGSRRLEESARR